MNETIKANIVTLFHSLGYGDAVRYALTTLKLNNFDEAIDIVDNCLECKK